MLRADNDELAVPIAESQLRHENIPTCAARTECVGSIRHDGHACAQMFKFATDGLGAIRITFGDQTPRTIKRRHGAMRNTASDVRKRAGGPRY